MKKAKTIGSVVARIATNFLLAVLLFIAVSQFKEIDVLAYAVGLTLGVRRCYTFFCLEAKETKVQDYLKLK